MSYGMWTIKFALSGNLIVQSKLNTNNLSSGYIFYNHLTSSAKTYRIYMGAIIAYAKVNTDLQFMFI